MSRESTEVLVVGAGATGLAHAWRHVRAGRDVVVLEATARVGGAIRTAEVDGRRIEEGPAFVGGEAPHLEALLETLPGAPHLSASLGELRVVRGGTEGVVRALAGALGERVRRDAPVQSLRVVGSPRRPAVEVVERDGRTWRAGSVALALPAGEQARLLEAIAEPHAEVLAALRHHAPVGVTFELDAADARGLSDVGGHVRPQGGTGRLAAALCASSFEDDRAPRGRFLVQTWLDVEGREGLRDASDPLLTRVAAAEVSRVVGRVEGARLVQVRRRALEVPRPTPGHRGRLARMQAAVGDLGLLLLGDHVCGSSLDRRFLPGAPLPVPPPGGVELV